ncbi:Gfo/Idh/MocA family oxidoreductase [bacterium]|nr:Gfo/Idh/MocA family oxidoreductase [bacterium]
MNTHTAETLVCGTGYWGKNHVRNFYELNALFGIYDHDEKRAEKLAQTYPCQIFKSYQDALNHPQVSNVVIASPAESHYELAKQAILAKKHVLVEKPLSLEVSHAQELIELAKQSKVTLMVGHLLKYHPCIKTLKKLLDEGVLGKLEYVYSNRLNLGKIRTKENILWSFAPHDISLMLWFTQSMPLQVNVMGGSYLQPNIADTTISSFVFPGGIRGHIYVSWLHPFKEQRLVLVGQKKMVVFDDAAQAEQKLVLYDKSVDFIQGEYVTQKPKGEALAYDQSVEPLKEECLHFLKCIEHKTKPLTDGHEGLNVLKVLHSCQNSLEMNGQAVQVKV